MVFGLILRNQICGVAVMPIGTVLLIFDLVEGRGAALFMPGMTLLAVIILASLPRFRGLAASRIRQTSEQDQLKETIMPGKKKPGHSVKDAKVYKKIQEQGGSKEKAAQIANASALRGRSSVGKSSSYDDWKIHDLRERAKALGLSGYSGKNKSKLVSMLRSH